MIRPLLPMRASVLRPVIDPHFVGNIEMLRILPKELDNDYHYHYLAMGNEMKRLYLDDYWGRDEVISAIGIHGF